MGVPDTTLGGSRREFPSTLWSTLLEAGRADPSARSPLLDRLIGRYWKPVYHYVRAVNRCSVEDAKDLTQGFFTRLLERDVLERLSEERGSFRGFIKKSVRNFLVDASRREKARRPLAGSALISFDDQLDQDVVAASENPEATFDRSWRETVVRGCIDQLEGRLRDVGHPEYFLVFRAYCLPGESGAAMGGSWKTYAEVARELGVTEPDVRKRLAYCRRELHGLIRERVREYAGSEEDVEAEVREVLRG